MLTQKRGKQTRGKRSPKSRNEGETLPAVGVGMKQEIAVLQEVPLASFTDPGHIYPPEEIVRDSVTCLRKKRRE